MASAEEDLCTSYPDFAVVCSFIEHFGEKISCTFPNIGELQTFIEDTDNVNPLLVQCISLLLRRIHKSVKADKWERALQRFAHSYSAQDGWELERFGFKKSKLEIKLRVFKNLLEAQFDLHKSFKEKVNNVGASDLRLLPCGRDKHGNSYWCQLDECANLRVYKDDEDEEMWSLVAQTREELVALIEHLESENPLGGTREASAEESPSGTDTPMGLSEAPTPIDSKNPTPVASGRASPTLELIQGMPEKEVAVICKSINSHLPKHSDSYVKIKGNELTTLVHKSDFDNSLPSETKSKPESDDILTKIETVVKDNFDNSLALKSKSKPRGDFVLENIEKMNKNFDNSSALKQKIKSESKTVIESTEAIDKVSFDCTSASESKVKPESVGDLSNSEIVEKYNFDNTSGSKMENESKIDKETAKTIDNSKKSLTIKTKNKAENDGSLSSCEVTSSKIESELKLSIKNEFSEIPETKTVINENKQKCIKNFKVKLQCNEDICSESIKFVDPQSSSSTIDSVKQSQIEEVAVSGIEKPNDSVHVDIINSNGSSELCNSKIEPSFATDEKCNSDKTGSESSKLVNKDNIVKDCVVETVASDTIHIATKCFSESNLSEIDILNTKEMLDISKEDEIASITSAVYERRSTVITVTKKSAEDTLKSDGLPIVDKYSSDFSNDQILCQNENKISTTENLKTNTNEKNVNTCQGNKNAFNTVTSAHDVIKEVTIKKNTTVDDTDANVLNSYVQIDKIAPGISNKNQSSKVDTNADTSTSFKTTELKNDNLNLPQENVLNSAHSVKEVDDIVCKSSKLGENIERKLDIPDSEEISTKQNIDCLEKCDTKSTIETCPANVCEKISAKSPVSCANNKRDNFVPDKQNTTVPDEIVDSMLSNRSEALISLVGNEDSKIIESKNLSKSDDVTSVCVDSIAESVVTVKENFNASSLQDTKNISESAVSSTAHSGNLDDTVSTTEQIPAVEIEATDVAGDEHITDTHNSTTAQISKNESEEAIEEPVMIVKGEGDGALCDAKNDLAVLDGDSLNKHRLIFNDCNYSFEYRDAPWWECFEDSGGGCENMVSDTIEEDIIYFTGYGEGKSCDAGNSGDESECKMSDSREDEKQFIDGKNRVNNLDEIHSKREEMKVNGLEACEEKKGEKNSNEHIDNSADTKMNGSETSCENSVVARIKKKKLLNEDKPESPQENSTVNNKDEESDPLKIDMDDSAVDDSKTNKLQEPEVKRRRGRPPGRPRKCNEVKDVSKVSIYEEDEEEEEDDDEIGIPISKRGRTRGSRHVPEVTRQRSARIAKIREKEEAERRLLEAERMRQLAEENRLQEIKRKARDERREKKKKKKKKARRKNNSQDPWANSSTSSSSEEEEEPDGLEEEEEEILVFKSDHEFSPESDIGEEDAQPIKRARTAKKVKPEIKSKQEKPEPLKKVEEELEVKEGEEDEEWETDYEDTKCTRCSHEDHPETILLCDNCDAGWHLACLRPPLFSVPEGDWICPNCEHSTLIDKLKRLLEEYENVNKKAQNEELRRQRLAYVNVSLANVIPEKKKKKRRNDSEESTTSDSEASDEDDSSESDDSSSSSSSESSSSEPPLYTLRARRSRPLKEQVQTFDELINEAIRDEMEAAAGAGNAGRGKDIQTIVKAQEEEEEIGEMEEARDVTENANKEQEMKEEECNVENKEKDKMELEVVKESPEKKNSELELSEEKEEIKVEQEGKEAIPEKLENEKVEEEEEEDDEQPVVKRKIIDQISSAPPTKKQNRGNRAFMMAATKKKRRLTDLDVEEEEDDSDEDFIGSSSEEEEEDEELSGFGGTCASSTSPPTQSESDDSDVVEVLGRSRWESLSLRRSTRSGRGVAHYDSDDDHVSRRKSKKKKKRKHYSSSEEDEEDDYFSSESDGYWHRRTKSKKVQHKKKSKTSSRGKTKSKKQVQKSAVPKKVAKTGDGEAKQKPRARIKYAKPPPSPSHESDGEKRRVTRGRQINYYDSLLMSDEEDEEPKKKWRGKVMKGEKRPSESSEYEASEDERKRRKAKSGVGRGKVIRELGDDEEEEEEEEKGKSISHRPLSINKERDTKPPATPPLGLNLTKPSVNSVRSNVGNNSPTPATQPIGKWSPHIASSRSPATPPPRLSVNSPTTPSKANYTAPPVAASPPPVRPTLSGPPVNASPPPRPSLSGPPVNASPPPSRPSLSGPPVNASPPPYSSPLSLTQNGAGIHVSSAGTSPSSAHNFSSYPPEQFSNRPPYPGGYIPQSRHSSGSPHGAPRLPSHLSPCPPLPGMPVYGPPITHSSGIFPRGAPIPPHHMRLLQSPHDVYRGLPPSVSSDSGHIRKGGNYVALEPLPYVRSPSPYQSHSRHESPIPPSLSEEKESTPTPPPGAVKTNTSGGEFSSGLMSYFSSQREEEEMD